MQNTSSRETCLEVFCVYSVLWVYLLNHTKFAMMLHGLSFIGRIDPDKAFEWMEEEKE